MAQPVATLATGHLETQGGGHKGPFVSTGPAMRNGLFSPHSERLGPLTLKAPGRSLRLATLSSWMVSVKAGQGEECSYLARLENSS